MCDQAELLRYELAPEGERLAQALKRQIERDRQVVDPAVLASSIDACPGGEPQTHQANQLEPLRALSQLERVQHQGSADVSMKTGHDHQLAVDGQVIEARRVGMQDELAVAPAPIDAGRLRSARKLLSCQGLVCKEATRESFTFLGHRPPQLHLPRQPSRRR